MKVKFLEHVIISDTIYIEKGEIYEAKNDGDFVMIRMEDDSTVKAPKSEIEGILEVIEENTQMRIELPCQPLIYERFWNHERENIMSHYSDCYYEANKELFEKKEYQKNIKTE